MRDVGLLALPLELVRIILDLTYIHPDEDSRTTTTYHAQILSLLCVCKVFYSHLLPRLFGSPVLLTRAAISAFTDRAGAVPLLGALPTGTLIQRLSLLPHTSPPIDLIKAWKSHLPTLLSLAPNLVAFTPARYTSHLPLEHLFPLTNSPSLLTSLNMLELYNKTRDDNATVVSLLARCPRLATASFAALNLLDPDPTAKAVYSIKKMLDVPRGGAGDDEGDEEESWTLAASDSVWARFSEALFLRERCGDPSSNAKGMRSLFFWQMSILSTSTLWEILELAQDLECFHLDAWSLLAPSSKPSPLYEPASSHRKSLDLARLVERLGELNLRELTFAPLLTDSLAFHGSFDHLIRACPTLTHLEVRADMLTPSFFPPLLLPTCSLSYLGIHVLPPHGPRFKSARGRPGLCSHIFVFEDHEDIVELAQAVGCLGGAGWPKGGMEEQGEESGWFEILGRCASGMREA
ncbi:hypothetical protein RQP46_010316 [Phenoliferia psychrophenolica]